MGPVLLTAHGCSILRNVTRPKDNAFLLGNWKVVPDQCLIVGQGGEYRLEPKVMELLVYLADHQDEVVKRDTLLSEVWQGVVVGDEALSRAADSFRPGRQIIRQSLDALSRLCLMSGTPTPTCRRKS